MFFGLFNSSTPTHPESTDWRGIALALFGGAALVFAVGYAITRPMTKVLTDADIIEKSREIESIDLTQNDDSTHEDETIE